MKRTLRLIAFTLITTVVHASGDLEAKIALCMNEMAMLKPMYEASGATLKEDCSKRAKLAMAWEAAGKPEISLAPNRCQYQNIEYPTPDACLDEVRNSSVSIIQVTVSKDTSLATLDYVFGVLKELGVEQVMFRSAQ